MSALECTQEKENSRYYPCMAAVLSNPSTFSVPTVPTVPNKFRPSQYLQEKDVSQILPCSSLLVVLRNLPNPDIDCSTDWLLLQNSSRHTCRFLLLLWHCLLSLKNVKPMTFLTTLKLWIPGQEILLKLSLRVKFNFIPYSHVLSCQPLLLLLCLTANW